MINVGHSCHKKAKATVEIVRSGIHTAFTLLLLLPGIAFAQGSTGPLVNTDTINRTGLSQHGISLRGDRDIINASSGSITVNGLDAYGISLSGTGMVTNDGTITTTESGSFGIFSSRGGSVTNNATIRTNGVGAHGILSSSRNTEGGDLINSTGATITTIERGASGIFSSGGPDDITNAGTINTMGDSAHGINSSGTGAILNAASGTVTTTGERARGIHSTGTGDITNEGTIDSSGHGINSEGENDQISNTGMINAGTIGIRSTGTNTAIRNTGMIRSVRRGIRLVGGAGDITNAAGGTITVTGQGGYGISSTGTGDITNEGEITSSTSSGVGIHSERNSAGNNTQLRIINTGLISSGGRGIFSSGNNEIINMGTITTTGLGNTTGIFSTGMGNITNEGEITSSAASGSGIRSEGNNTQIRIRNTGLISFSGTGIFSSGDDEITNAVGGRIITTGGIGALGINSTGMGNIMNEGEINSSGVGIRSTGDNSQISNTGAITSRGVGIFSDGIGTRINNSGTIDSMNEGGIFTAGNNTTITNSTGGVITIRGGFSNGISSAGTGVNVINEGTIDVDGGQSYGIITQGVGTMVEIRNTGLITTIGDDSSAIFSNGNDTITNADGGRLETDGDRAYGIITQGDGDITNEGMITTTGISSSGIFSERSSQIRNTGTIMTDGDQADGIVSTGENVTIRNDGMINTGGDFAYGISSSGDGAEITVGEDGMITTTGENAHGIVALGNSEITINGKVSARGEGSYAIRGSDSEDQTLILGAEVVIEGYSDLGESEGDDDVLDIVANPRPSQTVAIRGVDTIRSGAALVLQSSSAVAVLDPTGSSATRIALGAMTGQIRRQVFQRLDSRRLSRGAAAKRDAWGGLFGMVSDRDEDELALAWDHSLYGVSGGVDMLLDSGQRVGVFAGVGRNRVRTKVTSIRDTATHGFVGAYGQQSIGEFNLDGAVLFGYGRHDSDRTVQDTVTGHEVANGKYDNFYVSPSLSLKWFKELGEGVEFRPRAEISYTYGDFSGYTERETTHSNISFKGRSVHITDGRLELALARTFNDDQGEIEVRGGATFTHFGEDSLGASLDNGPSVSYRITGENTIRGGFAGIRIRYQMTDSVTMNGDLEYVVNSGGAESIGGNMWLGLQF